jgi:hypothetical protein
VRSAARTFAMRRLTAAASEPVSPARETLREVVKWRPVNASVVGADTRLVPTVPYRLRIPARCEFCHAQRAITLQSATSGQTVSLKWVCGACQRDWPVSQERRGAPTDRRRSSRTDRRTGKRS